MYIYMFKMLLSPLVSLSGSCSFRKERCQNEICYSICSLAYDKWIERIERIFILRFSECGMLLSRLYKSSLNLILFVYS